MELRIARHIAMQIESKLEPFVQKLLIGGSIRRERPEVKDIEIICLPKMMQVGGSLFDTEPPRLATLSHFITTARSLGVVIKGEPTGRYMQVEHVDPMGRKINVDLFMPTAQDFYRVLVIRTGSKEWVTKYIARQWRINGWVGTIDGLRLESQCVDVNANKLGQKPKWKCIMNEPTLPPVWNSEEEFFDWLKIEWCDPKYRNV